ncbi:MAG TPA: DUF305 domain-containing protein, partial [Candidatus Sericytochromatia bacterium]
MQTISLKTGFLAFSLIAIASLTSGILTACSSAPENSNQTQNTPTKEATGKQHMGHGSGMNHSMAMDLGPADADYELRFIDAMTPHHQGAVEMAK